MKQGAWSLPVIVDVIDQAVFQKEVGFPIIRIEGSDEPGSFLPALRLAYDLEIVIEIADLRIQHFDAARVAAIGLSLEEGAAV